MLPVLNKLVTLIVLVFFFTLRVSLMAPSSCAYVEKTIESRVKRLSADLKLLLIIK